MKKLGVLSLVFLASTEALALADISSVPKDLEPAPCEYPPFFAPELPQPSSSFNLAVVAVQNCLSNIDDCIGPRGIPLSFAKPPNGIDISLALLPIGYRYNLTSESYNQTKANTQCKAEQGGKLASEGIRNCLNLKAVYSYLGIRDDEVWIGLRRSEDNQHVWNWRSGGSLDDNSSLWLADEPNNSRDNEDCVTLKNGGLNDLACSTSRKGLCEIKI